MFCQIEEPETEPEVKKPKFGTQVLPMAALTAALKPKTQALEEEGEGDLFAPVSTAIPKKTTQLKADAGSMLFDEGEDELFGLGSKSTKTVAPKAAVEPKKEAVAKVTSSSKSLLFDEEEGLILFYFFTIATV